MIEQKNTLQALYLVQTAALGDDSQQGMQSQLEHLQMRSSVVVQFGDSVLTDLVPVERCGAFSETQLRGCTVRQPSETLSVDQPHGHIPQTDRELIQPSNLV